MKEGFVILVDENDNNVGSLEKIEAHQKALLHRAISVFIFNSKGEWLIQRRALNKYHSNGLWTNTCCSHPYPGETCLEAANRRLMEEMRLKCALRKVFSFVYKEKLENGLSEHELDHVFIGVTNDAPMLNTEEAMEWRSITFASLEQEIHNNPSQYTIWLKKIYKRVNKYI